MAGQEVTPVEIWMPNNHRDGVELGRHHWPGDHAVLIIYQPEVPHVVSDAAAAVADGDGP
jgi:hypothetical protein